ncbi:MAG: TIGR03118 family protein [Bryobacteraceae bacterium]|jgi:uncharacterized protein (TIGR03118 family)
MRKLCLLLFVVVASLSAQNSYFVHNLVSDLTGMADYVDPNLINPWGNGFSSGSPFWIGNNGTGTSTLYGDTGAPIPLVVKIPAAGGATTPGKVTGVIYNGNANSFLVSGQTPSFIFCSEDGVISGWSSKVDMTAAKVLVDNSASGASYKGCALGGTATAPMLYAADYGTGKVIAWDMNMNPVAVGFVNSAIPAGFAPFNIQNLGGTLYVAYAAQPTSTSAAASGYAVAGGGYVSTYDMTGAVVANLSGAGTLNYPWGLAIAPATFGKYASMVLVGNFGDGTIHAFDPTSGALMGTLEDASSNPITIDGLWSLNFGNGKASDSATLYFTAGIQAQAHGLFGSIQAAPSFTAAGIENAASSGATIAPNSFVSIFGGGLAATTHMWGGTDFVNNALPTTLQGVSVSINGEPAYVDYISPVQINILVPPDIPAGPVQIQVTNNGLASATISATMSAVAPAFFDFGPVNAAGNQYIAATHANGTPGGPPNYVTGVTSTPFTEGEIIILYGTGFGPTNPPVPKGQLITTAAPLATTPAVTIGGLTAQVQFAGVSEAGLYQFNVVVPMGLTPGTTPNVDVPVVIDLGGGAKTQSNAVISVTVSQ